MFHVEGRLFRIIEGFANFVILNILFCICSLPIISIGAAKVAHHHTIKLIINGEEGDIVKQFFECLRCNIKRVTLIWIGYIFCILIGSLDFYVCFTQKLPIAITVFFTCIASFVMIISSLIVFCFMILINENHDNINEILRKSFKVTILKLPQTILLLILDLIPVLGIVFFTTKVFYILTFFIVIGFSILEYIKIQLLRNHMKIK